MRNSSRGIGSFVALCASLGALGCGSSGGGGNTTDSGVPLSPGGSGAFGIVTVGGKQKMYLPQPYVYTVGGDATIAVVDVGVAGNGVAGAPALLNPIALGTVDGITATGGT